MILTLFAFITLGVSYGQSTAIIRVNEDGNNSYIIVSYDKEEGKIINLEKYKRNKELSLRENYRQYLLERDTKTNKVIAEVLAKGYKIKTSTSNSRNTETSFFVKTIYLVKEE